MPIDPQAATVLPPPAEASSGDYLPRRDDPWGGRPTVSGGAVPQVPTEAPTDVPALPPVRFAVPPPPEAVPEGAHAAAEPVIPATAESPYRPEESQAPAPGSSYLPAIPEPPRTPREPSAASESSTLAGRHVEPPVALSASSAFQPAESARWEPPPAGMATAVPPADAAAFGPPGPRAVAAAPTPSQRQWEGPQQPVVLIEKRGPEEMQVGKPTLVLLRVHNAGEVPAWDVVVTDYVPAGTQLLEARPRPQTSSDGLLVWHLGTLQPGEEAEIALHLLPRREGEIGSTAVVQYAAVASSRAVCTRPLLAIEHTAPPKVLIGQSLTLGITVSNPGTGPATGVRVEEDVPEGLSHVAGAQLEYEVGVLRPGESRHLELILRAERPGVVENTIRVRGDGDLVAEHRVRLEVIAPQLAVGIEGPRRRFLQRQATYALQVANPGTAPARDVELVAFLPRGMKFVQADAHGQYDPAEHAVYWSLAELPPAKAGTVQLTILPVEPGEQRLKVEGRGELGLTAVQEQLVQVEQAAELLHTVKDLDEVIEVGSETIYEIRVTNVGTQAATNVRLSVQMPPGMAALRGDGPTRASGDATQVHFEALPRLLPQEEVVYRVQAQARQPGDHLVRVQLSSDEWPTPVTREESTRVYQDR